jgi:hypothetical protein
VVINLNQAELNEQNNRLGGIAQPVQLPIFELIKRHTRGEKVTKIIVDCVGSRTLGFLCITFA